MAARNAWIVAPRSATDARPVGPNTINKRIRALANLWTTLDGPHAENPARELLDDELEEPEPIERDLPDTDVVRLFAHMPDVGSVQAGHAGDRRPTVSKTKIVLRVLAFTGMTPSTFARLRPENVRLDERLLRLPRRRKGRGVAGTWVPIIEPAAWALQAVEEHGLWGYRLSNSSANKSLRVAAARAGIAQRLTIHALRHSFGSIVFDATGNLELVAYLLQQMHLGTTMRYVLRRLATTRQQQLAPVEGRLAGALDAPPVPVPVRRAAPVEPGRCRCGAPIDQTARDPRGRAITRCRLCLDRRRRYRQATGTKTGTN